MPNPWDDPEYAPKVKTAQEPNDEEFKRRMDREYATFEAMDIQSSGYNVPIPEATSAPMVEEAAVKRPKDLIEAGSWLDEARKAHKDHERQLAEFIADTDSIAPTTAESARAIKERAAIIAKARRDLADNLKALEDADVNLTQARFLADKNPPDSEGLVGEVGKRLGFMKPLMNLLMAPGDIAKGAVMTGISGIGELTGNSFTQTDVDMGVADWVKAVTLIEPLFNSESKIRQRGRELPRKTGEAVTALMDAYVADTAIMKSFQSATGYENAGKQVAGLAGGAANIFVDLALDPLNVMELGPVTKGGKLRQLAKVNAGATEAVAVSKALQDIPEIINLLGDLGTAHKIALDGRLTTDLVKAGVDADKATELSKMFDERLVQRLAGYRGIAGATPKDWSRQVIHELDKLPATEATKAQRAAAQDVWKFGDSVDPINGRSVREQISLGQRGKVLQAFQAKFGDTPWYKAAGKPWAFMVGDSLKHDVADVPEIFAVYTAQRMMRGQAGREFLGFAQDVTEQAAKYLKQFEPQEVAQIQEALPRIVERTDKAGRAELRTSIAERYGKSDLSRAVLDLADLYEESATTIRAIENRFNLKVADVAGEFGYFGRQFSPELQQFLAEVPSARAWFFNESGRRSKEALDYGLMAPEKGRKLRDFDFTESENLVRNKMRELGYADDMPIWSRDAFGNLADRAKVSQRHAEVRTLYDNFVNVVGTPDAARLQELSAKISAEIAENQAANIARVEAASEALRKAEDAQAGFREGRKAVRQAEGQADALSARLGAAEGRAQEVRIVSKESGVESPAAYEAGRAAQERAVVVAEALKDEATDLVAKTPGALEARKALVQARKILASAKTTEAMELAAKELSVVTGGTSTGTDLVGEAEKLVELATDHIANNPAIKNADKALRAANAILADARNVAARVEVGQLTKHLDDLVESAKYSKMGSAQGGAFLTNAMLGELRKAREVAGNVTKYYQLRDAQKAAATSGDKALAAELGTKAKDIPHKSIREVRSALSTMRAELRKDAPAALVRLLDSAHERATSIAGLLDDAQQAVAKPVALAVNQRARGAQKALDDAMDAAEHGDMSTWTVDQKARWVEARTKKLRAPENITGLEVLRKANVPLPDNLDDLIKLGATDFTPYQAKQFKNLADGTIWQHIDKPATFWKVMDGLKRIYQKEVLGRAPSYARDVRSTVINAAMSGLTPADLRAAHKAVGSFETWRTTGKADDIVNRLRGEGVLQSTTSEAFRENRVFGKLAEETESKLGKLVLKGLDRVDERGMLGAIVPGKPGKVATKAQRFFNENRVYVEEVSRVATYMKARKAGADHASAVEEVFSRWGKFDELTKLERNVLNRIMFFWAWQARSIPVSIRHLIQHPVRSKLVLAMTAGNATEDDTMPPWLRRMGGWVLGRNANGQVDVVNLGGTYFDPLISIMQGNFANEVMHGRAGNLADVAAAAFTDTLKSAPPLVQAGVERFTKKDAFTGLDWWKDRNADKGISQAKAPTVLWWMHGDNPVSKALGLQKRPIQGGKGGQYLVMDPRWAWLMTAIPGAETNMADVSAFFRSPDIDAGDEPMPKLSLGRGAARVAGVPLYEVPLEDGMRQVFELKAALTKSAYSLAGGSLSESGGRLVPSKTYRGTELRAAMERWTAQAKAQGMTPAAAKRDMMDRMKQHYPAEWRVLEFQQRVEGWEQYLLNLRDGVMIDKDLADETVRNARKASTSRLSEFQLRKDTAEERKLFR